MERYERKTKELLDYIRLAPRDAGKREVYELNCLKGSVKAHGIMSARNISVSDSHVSEGSETDWHTVWPASDYAR